MADEQKRLQSLSDALQKTQDGMILVFRLLPRRNANIYHVDLQSAVEARQRLEAQQQENKAVQKEFDGLAEDAGIYKLVGPVLLKQDRTEALTSVNGRLDYIGKEITRTEGRIKELQSGGERTQVEMMQLQQKLQQATV